MSRVEGSILLGCALAVLLAMAGYSDAPAAPRPTVAAISQGLTCQCGCGLTVANCNHPTCSFSVPVREEIETMIGKGKSSSEIIAFYRHKYGEKVLSAPTTEGFNILAWLMPFAAVALGGVFIAYTASRWRSRPAAGAESAGAGDGVQPFDPGLKHRLEEEIREQS